MGKISDALDKIDSLKEIEIAASRYGKEKLEESTPQRDPSGIAIEKEADSVKANGKWDKRLFKAVHSSSNMLEVFNTLRSTILHPPDGRKIPQSIMVASAISKEGKSFITANLGVSFAQNTDQHCLLVDCNLHNPTLSDCFGIDYKYGLIDYLQGEVDLAEIIVKTPVEKLCVLASGKAPNKPEELISSTRMRSLVKDISSRYEDHTIIFDSPPMLMAAESIALASQIDAIIMVVRQRLTKKTEVQQFIDAVGKIKILGVVFNDQDLIN